MYTEDKLKEMVDMFDSSFEYAIMEINPKGNVVIGYCNSSDNPQELVDKMNSSGNSTVIYTYVENTCYSPDKALEFVEALASMLRDLGPSIFSSISLADLAKKYHKSTVI